MPDQVMRCMYGIAKGLKEGDQWESFIKYSAQIDPILRNMRRIGIRIEPDSANALHTHLEGQRQAYYDVMEQQFPPELLPYTHILKRPREGFDEITIMWSPAAWVAPISVSGSATTSSAQGANQL